MADYFTKFSFIIPTEDVLQQQWIEEYLEEPDFEAADDDAEDEWQETRYGITAERDGDSMWVTPDDHGHADNAAALVAEWQAKFMVKEPLSFEYATGCSKLRLDAFRGGAIVIFRGEVYTSPSAADWAETKKAEFSAE